jgi:hypothetical protein
MEKVAYVGLDGLKIAQEIEKALCSLPPSAGVIFAGVRPEPCSDGKSSVFNVTLGVSHRHRTVLTGVSLVHSVVAKMYPDVTVKASVFRGAPGASAHEGGQAALADQAQDEPAPV